MSTFFDWLRGRFSTLNAKPPRKRPKEDWQRLQRSSRSDAERMMRDEQRRLLRLVRHAPLDARAKVQGDLSRALVMEPFRIETPRGPLSFAVFGEISARRGANLLTKQPGTLAWIDAFRPDSVFWDIGANVGSYALYAALRPDIHVVAFEPAAVNYFLLAANCELNAFAHVECLPLALGSGKRLGQMRLSQFAPGRSFSLESDRNKPYESRQAALITSIDQIVEEYGVRCPNYIKLDVPALTRAVIEGGARTFRRPEVRELHVELSEHSEEASRVVEMLARAEFSIVARHARKGTADVTFAKYA